MIAAVSGVGGELGAPWLLIAQDDGC